MGKGKKQKAFPFNVSILLPKLLEIIAATPTQGTILDGPAVPWVRSNLSRPFPLPSELQTIQTLFDDPSSLRFRSPGEADEQDRSKNPTSQGTSSSLTWQIVFDGVLFTRSGELTNCNIGA